MFIEGKLIYRLPKEIGWLNANYKIAWADRMDEVTEGTSYQDGIPANGTHALRDIGLSFGYNAIKKEDYKIARATFFNRNSSKSITIPVKSYRLYGVHAGLAKFRTILAQGSTTSYSGTVSGFRKDTVLEISNATPMLNMNIISIGIHRQFIENSVLEINANGDLSETKSKFSSMVYADFLIGTGIVFDDLLVPLGDRGVNGNPNSNNYEPYNYYPININESYKKIPIGGRIGWEQVRLGTVGMTSGFEVGFRPGIFGPLYNAYMLFKIGVSFNFKAK
jgi:hypothetical protein